ncbi:MAG: Fe-S cluster assembly protein HesB [Candidatus Thorarchaeota archaeon]
MTIKLDENSISTFQNKIFSWWRNNKRSFPWRETTDPYKIMISEIMLQQTQTTRVIEKYLAFIQKFPTFDSLASAPPADVLSLWSGLGYNRRALWLQQASQKIISLGYFPRTPENLRKLKGIGSYTSRSILIFAFNFDIATVDTNIRRIFINENFATESTSEKEMLMIAYKLLPKGKARDWHNALMDYGSLVMTSTRTGIKSKNKQPTFIGSSREYRGKVIKHLNEIGKASLEELFGISNLERESTEKIIKSLIKDGLIIKEENIFYLPRKNRWMKEQ